MMVTQSFIICPMEHHLTFLLKGLAVGMVALFATVAIVHASTTIGVHITTDGTLQAGTITDGTLTITGGAVTAGTWSGTAIAITNGGTGVTSKSAAFDALSPMTTAGDLIYGDTAGTGTRLAPGTSTQVLHGGTIPSWAALSLTTDVTGTLPVTSGGTGLSALTSGDLLYASAADTLSPLPKGTALQVLRMNAGATAPEWADATGGYTVPSNIFQVGSDRTYITIQSAIDAASTGDVVEIFSGTYTGQVILKNGLYFYVWPNVLITSTAATGTITNNNVSGVKTYWSGTTPHVQNTGAGYAIYLYDPDYDTVNSSIMYGFHVVFRALVSQDGTNDPVVNRIFEQTIQGVTYSFSRPEVGQYYLQEDSGHGGFYTQYGDDTCKVTPTAIGRLLITCRYAYLYAFNAGTNAYADVGGQAVVYEYSTTPQANLPD